MDSIIEKPSKLKKILDRLIIAKMLYFINEITDEIEELNSEYENIEELLYPKRYPLYLLKKNKIIPKTLIAGSDNSKLLDIIKDIDMLRDTIKTSVADIETNIKNRDIKYRELMKYNKSIIDIDDLLSAIKISTTSLRNKLKIELPVDKTSIENAKKIRNLLVRTQSLGRMTEIIFTYFLKDILAEHGQLRRDYTDIQTQTNAIYNRLMVTRGSIQLDANNLGMALKNIIKDLNNIKGDLASLKMVILTLAKPTDESKEAKNLVLELLEKKRGL